MYKNTFAYWLTGLFLLATVFLTFFHQITAFDQDLGRHILLGRIISSTHSVPKINLFAYTYPNFPFINTHWVSEVFFYNISSTLGAHGLLIIMVVTVLFSFFCTFLFLSKKVSPIALAVTFLFYIMILVERTDIRPEIFSFLFVSIFIVILYKNREKSTRWIFLLPFLELLWVNMHIYFVVGIILISLFLIEPIAILFIDKILNPKRQIPNKYQIQNTKYKILSIIFILCCLTTLLNPNGLAGGLYPFTVFNNYGYSIQENQNIFPLQSLNPSTPTILFFEASICIGFLLLLLNRKKTSLIDWLLFSIFSYLGASQIRNTALFVFITFPIFAINLNSLIGKLFSSIKLNIQKILYGILFLLLIWEMIFISSLRGLGWDLGTRGKLGADFFIANHLKGPIFNNFDVGSYLDYRLYPNERVFVDGRPEAYPVDFFQKEYIPMQVNPTIFDLADKKYHFNTIFFTHTDQTPWAETFIQTVTKNPSWKIVYLDDTTIILVKNTNQLLPFTETDITLGKATLSNNYDNLLQEVRVLEILQWKDAEVVTLQKMLAIQTNSCQVLDILGNLLAQKNDPAASIYTNKYQQFCK